MARDWESVFAAWGGPPSQAEEDEYLRTERELRDALAEFDRLGNRRYRVFPKGSHRRGTNVRRGSDVDLAVELRGTTRSESFHTEKLFDAKDLSDAELGLVDLPEEEREVLRIDAFKKDVFDALVAAYGSHAVSWSNKCLKVREHATTLPADVVPCRYLKRYDGRTAVNEGIQIWPDKGLSIDNWPDQDDGNGKRKNARTSLRYKKAVRGLKALENEMTDNGVIVEVPSFLIESAVYNVSDADFSSTSNLQNALTALLRISEALDNGQFRDWVEVNELKYLFRDSQAWRPSDAQRLVDAGVKYVRDN